MRGVFASACSLTLTIGWCSLASAQPVVKVAEIQTDSSCSLLADYWGNWLVEECRENFPDLRARLQSATVESGKLALSTNLNGRDTPAADFIVSGRVTGLGLNRSRASARDYCVGLTTIKAALDLRVRDAAGRVVHAATISKSVEVGSHVVAGASDCSANSPGRASYDALQRELALAAVRSLSFELAPLQVTGVAGRRLNLNYGAPLLPVGMILQVETVNGGLAKYRITAANRDRATAEPMGTMAEIALGASVSVLESDDPAANGRRYDKVDLPL